MTDFEQRAFKLITDRCAAKIREAHKVADDQRKYIEFIRTELNNGADLRIAINSAFAGWRDDLKFLEDITSIMEEAHQ